MEEMVWPSSLRAHNISPQQQEHENAVDVLLYFLFPIWSTDIHCWFSTSEQGKKPIDVVGGTEEQKTEMKQLLSEPVEWSPENHIFFPVGFQRLVLILLLSKRFCSNSPIAKLPKGVLYIVFGWMSRTVNK